MVATTRSQERGMEQSPSEPLEGTNSTGTSISDSVLQNCERMNFSL